MVFDNSRVKEQSAMILDHYVYTLLKGLEKRGYKVNNGPCVMILDAPARFNTEEPLKMIDISGMIARTRMDCTVLNTAGLIRCFCFFLLA